MDGEYSLSGTATLDVLAEVHALFERLGDAVPPQDAMLFETAVVEVIGNLIKHGRPPGEVPFDLRLEVSEQAMVGLIDDWSSAGTPYLNSEIPAAEDVSGRGLPLVWALVDDFSVEDAGDHHVWRLHRTLA